MQFYCVHIILYCSFTAVAHIFNADSSEALDPSSLVTLLRKEESLTALHLASVPLLEAAAATSS